MYAYLFHYFAMNENSEEWATANERIERENHKS